jgi:RNA polymerase sigma-70 factor (ECF subfamily)
VEAAERQRLNELVVRLADGDREAFHPVFCSLAPLLRRFARRRLAAEDAEDVAQEALVKLFAHAARFDRDRDALAWALGIAAWEIRTALRKRHRRREVSLDGEALASRPERTPTPEDAAIAQSLDAALDDALRALPPRDQEALRDYAREERTLGVAPATFRKRVERALARLRRVFNPDRSTDERG